MSKSNAYETALLEHIFNNAAIANIGDASGLPASAIAGSLYVAWHTADPGEAGDQTTSECAYTGYNRKAVARSGAGWVVTGNSVSPAADVTGSRCTAGTETATWFSVGVAASGASMILAKGLLDNPISIVAGVTPQLLQGTTITED